MRKLISLPALPKGTDEVASIFQTSQPTTLGEAFGWGLHEVVKIFQKAAHGKRQGATFIHSQFTSRGVVKVTRPNDAASVELADQLMRLFKLEVPQASIIALAPIC